MDSFQAIVHRVVDGVVVHKDGIITFNNPSFAQLIGYDGDHSLAGCAFTDLVRVPPSAAGPEHVCEGLAVDRDGAEIPITLVIHAPFDFGGESAVLAIIRDVTEQRTLHREMLRMADTAGQRLAQELHDGLGQELAAIKFQAKALEQTYAASSTEAAAAAAELVSQIQEAGEHVRQLAHGLAEVGEGRTIATLLETLARNTRRTHPVECHCFLGAIPKLSPAQVFHLHRIAQEATSNALKHGRARKVEIALTAQGGLCRLTVTDNGGGFSGTGSGSGIGLRLMKSRAKELNGKVEVTTKLGGGTVVQCTFPSA
jgi:two-component system sensor kinase FixL